MVHPPAAPAELHVATWGNGTQNVLALHGWGGSDQTFEPLRPLLEAAVTLCAINLPGHRNSLVPARWDREAWLAPMLRWLDAQPDNRRFVLLGNCSGALAGLELVLRRPNRFVRSVLVDPFAYAPWYFRVFLWPVLGRIAFWSTFANPIGRWLTNLSLARHRGQDTHLTATFAAIPARVAWKTLRLLVEIGDISAYAALGQPVTIVHGARTFGAVRASLARWKSIWPHAAIRVADAGHLPIAEAPAQVAAALLGAEAQGD